MRTKGFFRASGIGVLVVLMGVWAGSAYSQGQPPPQGAGRGMPGMGMQGMGLNGPMNQIVVWRQIAGRLNLTPDQQQSVRQMLQSSDIPQIRRDLASARRQLADAIVTSGDYAQAASRLADLESQLTTRGAALTANIFQQVLTDAQRTRAKQLLSTMQQRQQQRQLQQQQQRQQRGGGRAGRQRG
jgi:hypothetical protein